MQFGDDHLAVAWQFGKPLIDADFAATRFCVPAIKMRVLILWLVVNSYCEWRWWLVTMSK
ncbi:MAG TPA: hypothetical protein DEB70_00425 [Planctomycetaceae bacterium]|nr:hypothetical protein [Planctomycetaceae bacterium]